MPERKSIKKANLLKDGDPKYDRLKALKKEKISLEVIKNDLKDLTVRSISIWFELFGLMSQLSSCPALYLLVI